MKFYFFIMMLFMLASCSPFDTRNPEEPEAGTSTYVPPTSPEIVIQNFKASILEKNLENYMNCFTANAPVSDISYSYIPSPQVLENFPTIFNDWQLEDERRIFTALTSNIPKNIAIELELHSDAKGFESRTPDSALYVSGYSLKIPEEGEYSTYSGVLQFNIISTENSLWRVNKWIDNGTEADTSQTWSSLKGKLY